MVLPEDSSSVMTVPITLDIASNHGVIVASKSPESEENIHLVENLLQKPSLEELAKNQAILDDGRTLLETGLIAVRGQARVELVRLACSCQSMITELLKSKKEISLYEDLVAAWVPAKHEWLRKRQSGEELVTRLGKHNMFSYCAYELLFLHFGTSGEVLEHLSGLGSGIVGRRHLCSILATTESDIAASAVILSSNIAPAVSNEEDSLVYSSSIASRVQIGSQCIVIGIDVPEATNETLPRTFSFMLPDRHCLWEVPLVGYSEKVLVYCGLHDNPKNTYSRKGTFCGKPWKKVLFDLAIEPRDLWSSPSRDNCLWNAKLFPIASYSEMLDLATWLMGLTDHRDETLLHSWRTSQRISLEELHRSIDFCEMCTVSNNHQAHLAAGIARACINYGLLGRDLSQLCEEILEMKTSGVVICKDLLEICPWPEEKNAKVLPRSRAYQVQVDLLRACGDVTAAQQLEEKVWDAVADETASAVRYGFKEHLFEHPECSATSNDHLNASLDRIFHPKKVTIELPVRVDFVGGWSDTPPWSLERAGFVLNMAVSLEGSLPIGATIETTKEAGISISDDAGNTLFIEGKSSIAGPFAVGDPFLLVKSALLVTGIAHEKMLESSGLWIKTWANVPRGSGLGTSSILAAAVVKGLLQISGRDESNENVARLVLVLEQIMGTGGRWQDQIGGLYPGIKCTASFPVVPLQLHVVPLLASAQLVSELQQQLLVTFTGQVRLAHKVLEKVVTRYLRRDNLLISSIKRLMVQAKMGREAMMNCDVDELGEIMLEAWRLHQELDPYCSNEFVDRLFSLADPYCSGYKLVGAGGGGFALLLGKDAGQARELRELLEGGFHFDVKVYKWEICLLD